ncbi:aspartate ammonia-lyase [Helicobacter sp. 16-1353]|uniref:aspartate ammonia-lyase n=1 Tax=Helicobacter sp. 16-1353 TaxID=2004996 RepID=UPI000DCD384B|nr:aspartate ammonia-lyase [Helicobacter sp. 16-1353]RAX54414.1 aspartate ammonia-lyase [Helicobacter sp. 16-1353]
MKRIERDFIGEMELSDDCYYGIQTLRAIENFPISKEKLSDFPIFISSIVMVKKAAALANFELGLLDSKLKDAIIKACDRILEGEFHEQFVVPMIQGGAGTSTNMNANEVIANVALEILGHKKGEYEFCHPNDHINKSQSTNDVYPTAIRLALYLRLGNLAESMKILSESFERKAKEFEDVIKMGRTQLQDAVPMTLGQEFSTFASMLQKDSSRILDSRNEFKIINLGGTAIGTGINAPKNYKNIVESKLREVTNIDFVTARNLIEATQSTSAYVQLGGVLKRAAVKLSKICNDLRLLSSGPRAGLNEINLPKMQPGSSIMPGKVNPVIPEVVNQVCYLMIGSDMTITMAAEGGQLQLNVFEPVIVYSLLNSIILLENANLTLATKCINGITANKEICKNFVLNSVGIVTALSPIIGYEKSASIAKEALNSNRNVYEITLERGYLSKEELDRIFSIKNMIN